MVTPTSVISSDKLALIVGIDVYRSEGLEDLLSCKKDAKDVYELLSDLDYTIFGNHPIIGSELEEKYGWVQVHEAIRDFFKNAKPHHTLLFYFSGHGIQREDEVYLAMPGVDPKEPIVGGYSLSTLTRLMNSSKSMKIVSIIDACYSGAASLPDSRTKAKAAQETAGRALATYDRILDNIPRSEGRCFLLSSQAYQPSLAMKNSNSLYTKYVIEALRGSESSTDDKGTRFPASVDDYGNVTPETLHKYVYHKVANEVEQVPKIKFDRASEIILAEHPELLDKPSEEPEKPKDSQYFLKLLQDGKIEEFNALRNIEDIPLLFRKADLAGKRLIGVDLHDAELSETKLVKTRLNSANLSGTRLRGADLTEADLGSADLVGANLTRANLTRANLRGADLKGMIDFTGANLTGADLRGADLKAMVNFENAILHDVDFTGAVIDNKLINFNGADISNCKGLQSVRPANEYIEALKSFSEDIIQQLKAQNVSAEQLQSIEENMKELAKEVEKVDDPEKISEVEKENLYTKLTALTQKVVQTVPNPSYTLSSFTTLVPFSKLICRDIQQLAKVTVQKKEGDANKYNKTSEEYYKEGLDHYNLNKYSEAIECFDKALKIKPTYDEALKAKEAAYEKLIENRPSLILDKGIKDLSNGDYDDAIASFDKVIAVNPKNASAHRYKGNVYSKKGEYKQALECYDNALAINSKYFDALRDKGLALHELGDYGEAVKCYDKALDLKPNQNIIMQYRQKSLIELKKISVTPEKRSHESKSTTQPIAELAYGFERKYDIDGRPTNITVDFLGCIYVSVNKFVSVRKFLREKSAKYCYVHKFDPKPDKEPIVFDNERMTDPRGIAVNLSGDVYIADYERNYILKFDSDAIYITKWGYNGSNNGEFIHPNGISVDSSGAVYVADSWNHRIQKFDSNGKYITKWGTEGSEKGQFEYPVGITVDSLGYVYVADNLNRIQKFDSNGKYIAKLGSFGSRNGYFNDPHDIAIDPSGHVYVADTYNNRIQIFDSNGKYIAKWGGEGSSDGQFNHPNGIAIDASGRVYVADTYNNRIQKFQKAS